MKAIRSFENAFFKGFALSNNYESLSIIVSNLHSKNYELSQNENNFFITQRHLKLLIFFVNDLEKDFKFKDKFIKIIGKKESDFTKFSPFLKANHFSEFELFKQMRLEKSALDSQILKPCELISLASGANINEVYTFLTQFFSPEYLFYFSKDELENKAKAGEILLYKEKNLIKGALIFSKSLNSTMLDFIAVSKDLEQKNAAYLLMNAFVLVNKEAKFYQLFVRNDNERAIKFYQKFGFEFKDMRLKFYKKDRV